MSVGVTRGICVDPPPLTLLDRPRSALLPNERASTEAVVPLPPGVGVNAKDPKAPTPPLLLGVMALWLLIRWCATGEDISEVTADITLLGLAMADAIASSGVCGTADADVGANDVDVGLASIKKDTTLLLRDGRFVREDNGGGF